MNLTGRIDQEDTLIGDHVRLTFLQYRLSKVISGKQGRQPYSRTIDSTGFYKSPVSQSKDISPAVTTKTVSHILPDLPTQFQHPIPSNSCVEGCKKDN